MTEDAPTPVTLAEDVEDLRATVAALAAQLEDTTAQLHSVLDTTAARSSAPGDSTGAQGEEGDEEDKPAAPPLILRLAGDEYDAELYQLGQWVQHVLVPVYLNEVSSTAPWCPYWWQHDQAVARLHAAWTAWQELTTPAAGGWSGPSIWHRDHLDPCIAQIRSPYGPFIGCQTNPERPQHHGETCLPVEPVPPPPSSS